MTGLSKIYYFYSIYQGKDSCGRQTYDIIEFTDQQLEDIHDYIRWLFPTKEPSNYSLHAPILTDQDIYDLASDSNFEDKFEQSFYRMLKFYFYGDFPAGWWCHPINHNLLRITRIIKSLMLFGEKRKAEFFYNLCVNEMNKYHGLVPPTTLEYWAKAAGKTRYF